MDEHEAAELDTPSGTTGGTVAETPASPGDRPSARPAGRAKGTMIALAGGVLALVLVALLIVSRLSGGGSTGLSGAQASATAQAAGTVAALATTVAQSVATARAAPTATAEALAGLLSEAHVVYATHVPGPGCDSGGAVWVVSDGATVKCLRGGLQLTSGAGSQNIAEALCLQLPTGDFPQHYLFSVVVSNLQPGTAATVSASGTFGSGFIVNVGETEFSIYGGTGGQPVASGPLDKTGTTKVAVLATAGEFVFLVNGAPVGTYHAAPSSVKDFDLGVYYTGGSLPGQAEFSDFTLSALP